MKKLLQPSGETSSGGCLGLSGGAVLTPAGIVTPADVFLIGDRIKAVGQGVIPSECRNIVSIDGYLVTPGLIDVHIHGFGGHSWLTADRDGIRAIRAALVDEGVTSCLATLSAAPVEAITRAAALLSEMGEEETGCLGIVLEGLFINPEAAGAQEKSWFITPGESIVKSLLDLPGILEVVVAPELEGGINLIKVLKTRGIIPAVGHSLASGDTLREAKWAGARLLTHFFNNGGGQLWGPRDPGLLGAGLGDSEWWLEIINDGIHVHPDNFRLLVHCRGQDRVMMVSDSRLPAGMPDGSYQLGDGVSVSKKGDRIVTSEGRLAGGGISLGKMVGNLLAAGYPPVPLFNMSSANPARFLGLYPIMGTIQPGSRADLVVWSSDGKPVMVMAGSAARKSF